ncbi:MAG: hypothetical protein ABIP90_02315 [Vicinamibacterales bacterium]
MPTKSHPHALIFAATVAVLTFNLGTGGSAAQTPPTPTPKPTQTPKPTPAAPQLSGPDAAAVASFLGRVNDYVAVHKKLEDRLKKLPKDATPKQIDRNERALNALIRSARKTAKRGDLFTPEITVVIKRVMAQVFGGPDGQKLRSSVMDENLKELPLKVNQRYPDGLPMTTMPLAVLKALPELPEQMQYRFVASQFVLLDPHANVVADFIAGVLPPIR